jgi:hypothetical protein
MEEGSATGKIVVLTEPNKMPIHREDGSGSTTEEQS